MNIGAQGGGEGGGAKQVRSFIGIHNMYKHPV